MRRIAQALQIALEYCGQRMADEVIADMATELSAFPEEDVVTALKRCRAELKSIRYADILDRLPGQHPGAEHAWGLVSNVMNNEHLSLCWTDEMKTAYGVAAPLAEDRVAARMAFKETYAKLVSEARGKRTMPKWSVSLGWDKSLRDECVREAAQKNLISQVYAAKLLAHDPSNQEAVKLLECAKVSV